MKRHSNFSILMLVAILMVSLSTTAQNKTVVYGSLGVDNVNISVSNSPMGTSTDALGRYSLSLYDRTKPVKLHYSCIGYNDTIVSLSPKQLQHDSVNISFSMRFKYYALKEVTVKEKAPEIAYAGKSTSIVDYEINDMGVYIIGYRPNSCSLLHMSFDFDTLSVIPIDKKFKKLYKDVYGQIHLISYDSAYQIGHRQYHGKYMKMELFYGMKNKQFYLIFGDNVAATDKVFITGNYESGKQELFYYCRKKGDPKPILWEYTCDSATLELLDRTNSLEKNISNVRCPDAIYDPVFNNKNKLYYFNFDRDRIVTYNDAAERIDTIPMTFHKILTWKGKWEKLKSWKRIVMMDAPRNKFYTAFEEESVTTIKEINIKTGNTTDVVRLSYFYFVQNLKVHNGILYFLYPTGYDHRKALFKMKLD